MFYKKIRIVIKLYVAIFRFNPGEIIAMSPNMRTIFEPMDVEVASPATISRNGMVYFEPHLMGYDHLVHKIYTEKLPAVLSDAQKEVRHSFLNFKILGNDKKHSSKN